MIQIKRPLDAGKPSGRARFGRVNYALITDTYLVTQKVKQEQPHAQLISINE